MIVAGQKPLSEILKTIEDFNTIAVVACGTCVTVCMSGGEKDAAELTEAIRLERGKTGKTTELKLFAPKRQCDDEFLDEILEELKNTEAVLSLGCGAGVQFIAEKLTTIPVLPALNTTFLGVTRDVGLWAEMCQGCGECVLEKTGGICPVARCSKSNLNGPCGGSSDGKCEVDAETDCAWQLIYDRLKALNRLDKLSETIPPKDWRTSRDGGPRTLEKKEVRI